VLRHPSLRAISLGTASSNLFGTISFSIYLAYVVRVLLLSPAQIGLVFAIGNVGTLGGAVLASRIARRLGLGPTIVGSLFIGALNPILLAVAPVDNPIPFLIASGVFGGIAQMVYNINQVSYRQAICPPRMLGRMNATVRFIVWGTIPVGSIIGGVLGSTIGLHETIWISAVLSLVSAIFPLLSPVRTLRDVPEPVGADSDSAPTEPEVAATA
jgi:MFS family permease